MTSGLHELWLATGMLVLAAAALATFGRHERPRGWLWWIAAIAAAAAGAAAAAWAGTVWQGALAAQLLLLLWPACTLWGVRRFHGRIDWPTSEVLDATVFALCAALVLSGPLWPADGAMGPLAAPLGFLVSALYAASLLFVASSRPETQPTRLLAAVLVLAALVPMLWIRPDMDSGGVVARSAAATAVAALAMAFVVIALVSDRRERQWRASRRRLRTLAHIDALTRVPNRRRFEELASRALTADVPGSAMLLMFDIDHFKRINDQLGHAAGDRALRLVSHCLVEALRAQDVPGRHGGDEFALLLRKASVRDAIAVAQRLVERVQAGSDGLHLPVLSLSFGVVQVRPLESVEEALRRADQALYEAKRQGRARAVAATGNEAQPVFTISQQLGLTGV